MLILLLIFLIGGLFLGVVCHFLKEYCTNLSEALICQSIVSQHEQFSAKGIKKAEIKDAIFNYAPNLSFYFIDISAEAFKSICGIVFECYFLSSFFSKKKIDSQLKKFTLFF